MYFHSSLPLQSQRSRIACRQALLKIIPASLPVAAGPGFAQAQVNMEESGIVYALQTYTPSTAKACLCLWKPRFYEWEERQTVRQSCLPDYYI